MEKTVVNIDIPSRVENNYNGFLFFSELFVRFADVEKEEVVFSFKRNVWFEANLTSVLACLIEMLKANNCRVLAIGIDRSVQSIFLKNGFFSNYNLGSMIDTYDSTIPFKRFECEDAEGFTEYLNNEVIPKIKIPLNEAQIKQFKSCLQEVFINVGQHAEGKYVFACGQYYHVGKKVAFTIADIGETIGSNVRRKLPYELIDCDAIDWSTEFGNTTKVKKDGGIGLSLLKDFMEDNGTLHIISGEGYWEQTKGDTYIRCMKAYFGGTIVNIVSDLQKPIDTPRGKVFF